MEGIGELIKHSGEYGIFASMFTLLLYYVLNENKKREAKYIQILESFGNIINVKLDAIEKCLCSMGAKKDNE
jgi:hypothetical protein